MTGRWRPWCIAAVEAGAGVGLVDAGLAMGWHGEWLPSRAERFVFALSLASMTALVVALIVSVIAWSIERVSSLPPAWRSAVAQGFAIGLGFIAGFGLFSGTAMRHSPARPWAILATVAACALIGQVVIARRDALSDRMHEHPGLSAAALLLASAGLYIVHALVLVRLYPVLHALAAVGSLAALVTALVLGIGEVGLARTSLLLAVIGVGGVAGGASLMRSQTRRSLARERAPVASYLVRAIGAAMPARHRTVVIHDDRASHGPGLDLQGTDVVLITVDALRPDRLGAYGGPAGLTPALDALAREAVVVEHAYCTTPHTSYSLASLMTGKFFREVSALGPPSAPHETLAGAFGRAGYRTAGFYPPAIWQVDGERLGDLRPRGFDFADRFEGWDDAPVRVARVASWLHAVPPDRHVFVWVHLFEPHESYDAHPGSRASGTTGAMGRYDSEVSVVDDAVGALRRLFAESGRRPAWIVTADHGEEFGEHGGQFHGTTVYEEQVRVPLLVVAPGLAPRRIAGPVSLVDVMPTLLAGLGQPRPARLRGRELGPELNGGATTAAVYASASSLRLVAWGEERLICDVSEGSCALFDLAHDAAERLNLADASVARVSEMRGWLAGWEGSHARFDAERDADVMPEAAVRVLQGDRASADDAARALGTLTNENLRRAIRGLAALDVRDDTVRNALAAIVTRATDGTVEAAVALTWLGDARGDALTRAAVSTGAGDLPRRAALGLAHLGRTDGVPLLCVWALDASASDAEHDAVLDALEPLHSPLAFDTWIALLANPRLVVRAATALGALGDPRAIAPLENVLATSRYLAAQIAAARALVRLDAPDLASHVASAIALHEPDAFALAHALDQPGALVAGVAPREVRSPGFDAVVTGTNTVASRALVRVISEGPVTLTIDGQRESLGAGTHTASFAHHTPRLHVTWDGPPGTFEALFLTTH